LLGKFAAAVIKLFERRADDAPFAEFIGFRVNNLLAVVGCLANKSSL